jgi:hypothetical protein
MIHGHELIIDDEVWAELCERVGSPYSPRHTLLCPECIEELMGRPLTIMDLTIISRGHKGKRVAIPMNLWYYRQSGMIKEAWPYIAASIKHAGPWWISPGGRQVNAKRMQKDAWIKAGLHELENKV